MNKRIVYTRPDGGVSVLTPAPELFEKNSRTRALLGVPDDMSDELLLAFIAAKDIPPDALNILEVTVSELPTREFRNAWKIVTNKVEHDMEKCRDIWRDRLREMRKPLLEALDVEYQRADESKDDAKKTEIANKKTALRNITADPRIAAATTIEELKLVVISEQKNGRLR